MLEVAAAAGEIELKYLDESGLQYVEPSELHLLPTWTAETFVTNSATRSETEYFRANPTVANSPVKLGQPSSALMSRFLTRGLFKGCPSFTRFSPAPG